MPIRPENKKRYPKNWKEISDRIRFDRAGGKCEHFRYTKRQGETVWARCFAEHGKPHPITGSIVILTVAHLNHKPEDCRDENLEAMCQRCHLNYDSHHHNSCDKTKDFFNE